MKEKEQDIDPRLKSVMNEIGLVLGSTIRDNARRTGQKPQGFALFIFDFGDGGRINYISNAERADMIATLKEFIAKSEGRFDDATDFTKKQ
ncbi:MAG TPA: hypothetical protein VGG62_12170 [Terracidiphilus sp.]